MKPNIKIEKLIDQLYNLTPQDVLQWAAATRPLFDPWAQELELDVFLANTVPTEAARLMIEAMKTEPDDEMRELLIEVARACPALRKAALSKAGCPTPVIEEDLAI